MTAVSRITKCSIAILLCLANTLSFAVDPMPFRDAAEEARFRALAAELRCVMCQNQSLADSDAPIAHDLRNEVLELMQSGKSDDEIKAFLTERYTDFVLYRPAMRGSTLWIWIAPPLVLVVGAISLFFVLRSRRSMGPKTPPVAVNEDEWQ
ncbi:MAG: cytochrome c-type biogenesis protein CcmH [Xanthomonadales bacterium]|jgi:cytochrome c-type biogenesis protein CcmH|nr:cytochrome c-type biogenesis protein CcmH [Xanthomonadales bacterium]